MSETDFGLPKRTSSPLFDPESGHSLIVALDDSAISGPEGQLRDMGAAISLARSAGANAVLGFAGMFRHFKGEIGDTAGILNLTLSTEGPNHLRKVLVGRVGQAYDLGVKTVSVHVNMTSPFEPEMLGILGQVVTEAGDDLDVLAHVYPRAITPTGVETHYDDLKKRHPEKYAKMVRHGARVAADLGADIIKVPYTGSPETFATVVESGYGLPIIVAGGPKTRRSELLDSVSGAMQAGARGAAIGRNFFQRGPEQGGKLLKRLDHIIHDSVI
ncbi:MAG TPA: hypothetical protein VG604_01480 [Candidatus Saccharimonadales bacterium]|nr:hypothetical protein [Candidatus Saccharimonadales bacterium]